MNLIGLFGNSTLLGGSSSASFSNFFPFLSSSWTTWGLLCWPGKRDRWGLNMNYFFKEKGERPSLSSSSCHPLHFFLPYTFFLFSTLSSLNVKSQADYILTVLCVLSFSSTSLLFSASLLFCFGSHIITPHTSSLPRSSHYAPAFPLCVPPFSLIHTLASSLLH